MSDVSLRGKVLEKRCKVGHGEKEVCRQCEEAQWTPYNADLSMQGIKVRIL
jgi:hypothetical protein